MRHETAIFGQKPPNSEIPVMVRGKLALLLQLDLAQLDLDTLGILAQTSELDIMKRSLRPSLAW